jgi:hypothetical protein
MSQESELHLLSVKFVSGEFSLKWQKESTSYVGWLVCFITLETCVALGDGQSDSSKMKVLHLIYNLDAEFRH